MADFKWTLGFDVEKQGIDTVKRELDKIRDAAKNNKLIDPQTLQEALRHLNVFEKALEKAFNKDLGKLDVKKFANELKNAGLTLGQLKESFAALGADASNAFAQIESRINYTGLALKKTNKLVESMATTLKNTLKWNIASGAINYIQGSVQRAVGFIRDLDDSLNKIKVVTNLSSEEMSVFAKEANEAAKTLGQTTIAYSDASLIFFQQGKSAQEVRELTKATLIGANITGESVADTSELLTAALNGFNLEADKSMEIMDKFAAVGASTGSDFNELATGFSKVASMASAAGVEVDQLNGMLATVSTVTREAPESIGISFKTIFSRMSNLKAGKADEEGWTLGDSEAALNKVNISLIDEQTGAMRDLGKVIEEVGNNWNTYTREAQLGITTALAGSRQQNRLIALFNSWDMYTEAVKTSQDAQGTAMEQNLVRMDSFEYKSKQLRAELEELWMKIIDSDALKGLTEMITGALDQVNNLIDAFGGLGPVLVMVGGILARTIAGPLATGINSTIKGFEDWKKIRKDEKDIKNGTSDLAEDDLRTRREEYQIKKYLTTEDQKQYKELQNIIIAEKEKLELVKVQVTKAEKLAAQKLAEKQAEQKVVQDRIKAMRDGEEVLKRAANEKNEKKAAKIIQEEINDLMAEMLGIDKQALITREKNKSVQSKIRDFMEDYADNMEVDLKQQQKLNRELEEEVAIKKESLRVAQEDGESQKDAQITASNRKIADAEGGIEKLTSSASKIGKIQTAISGISAAITGITGLIGAFKQFTEANGDPLKQADAIAAEASTVASTLMMMPTPYTMIAGAALQAITVVGKFVYENTGLRKIIKENAELLKRYAENVTGLKEEMRLLISQEQAFAEVKELLAMGIGPDAFPDEMKTKYQKLSETIAKAHPELIKFYDEEGNAVVDLTVKYDDLLDRKREQIRQQNMMLVDNASGFIAEYSNTIKTGESEMQILQAQIDSATERLKAAREKSDYSGINSAQSQLDELKAKLSITANKFAEVKGSINSNIVVPFMNGSEEIARLDDSLKSVIASAYDLDIVTKILKGENADAALQNLQDVMNKTAASLNYLSIKAQQGNEKTKSSLAYLASLGEGTKQALVNSFAEIPLSIAEMGNAYELTVQKIEQSKTRILTNPLQVKDIIAFDKTEFENINNEMASQINDWKQKEQELQSISDKIRTGSGLSDAEYERTGIDKETYTGKVQYNYSEYDYAATQQQIEVLNAQSTIEERIAAIKKERESVEANLQERQALTTQGSIEQIEAQERLNELWEEGLFKTGETVEGKNQLIEAYNAEYDAIGSLIDMLGDDFMDAMDEFNSAFSTLEVENGAQAMADALGAVPDSLIEKLGAALPEIQNDLNSLANGTATNASQAASNVANAVQAQRERIGTLYAAIKQDDASYFQSFLSRNQAQTAEAFRTTGVMADNYSTYAEYKKALDEGVARNEILMSDASLRQTVTAARDKALAEYEHALSVAKSSGDANQVAAVSAGARAKMQKIAALEGAIAEKQAALEVVKASKAAARSVADAYSFFSANRRIALEELTKFEIQEKAIAATIEDLKTQLEKAASDKINGTGTDADSNSSKVDLPNFNFGGSMSDHAKTPKLQKITLPKKDNKDSNVGGVVNKDGGKNYGSSKQEVEDMEWEKDALHDTNVLLQVQGNLLKQLKSDEEKLYGKEKMDNLTKQNEALAEKKKLLEQQLEIIKQQGNEMKNELSKQGVKFNTDGTVANYNEIIQSKVNAANALSGDAKKKAQNEAKALMDALKKYEDFVLKARFDKEQAIDEVEKLQRAIYMEQFEYTIKVQLELSEDQQKILDFMNDMNKEFKDMSETYENTMSQLSTSLGTIEAIQAQIEKTKKDGTLTDKERIGLLEKYEDELQKAVKKAAKLQDELEKINENALKKGLDLLDNQLNKYENIDKQLDNVAKMMKLLGEANNYEQMDKIYETQIKAQEAQLDALVKARGSLADYISKLEVGSEEWEYANDQLAKMDDRISKITQNTLKTFQDEFNNSINGIMSELEKQLFGGKTMKEAKDAFKEFRDEQKKYLSAQEKIVSLGDLQAKIQARMENAFDPKARERLQAFMDNELDTLKEKDKLTEYDVERAEKMYDITLKQIALEEARANKTLMRLVRDSSGNWSYQYVEDAQKVQEAQTALSDELRKLMEFDEEEMIKRQEAMLDRKEKFYEDIFDIIKRNQQGQYANEAKFHAALEAAQAEFNADMATLQGENAVVMDNIAESTLAAILDTYARNGEGLGILTEEQERLLVELGENVGGKWEEISALIDAMNSGNATGFLDDFVTPTIGSARALFEALDQIFQDMSDSWIGDIGEMIGGSTNFETAISTAIDGIKSKWGEYLEKVGEITELTGTDLDSLIAKTGELDTAVDGVKTSTEDILGVIKDEWNAVSDLIDIYQDLRDGYTNTMEDVKAYIKALDDLIKKQKEAATGVETPKGPETPNGSGGSGGGGTTPQTKPAEPPKPTIPSKGSIVRVKSGRRWYYDSYGQDPSGKTDPYSSKDLKVVNTSNNKYKYAVGTTDGTALGWLRLEDLQGFRTGGYTGEWGNDGKLAMLHEKEIVLNKEDTKNILDAVQITRDYSSMIRGLVGGGLSALGSFAKEIVQQITINAEFPDVKSSFEIEKAFENLSNRASQFAKRK